MEPKLPLFLFSLWNSGQNLQRAGLGTGAAGLWDRTYTSVLGAMGSSNGYNRDLVWERWGDG